jgi:S-adenosyl-L-methionine hydrolase (adenosine-forming)
MPRPIVFLTDYGLADEFVGICRGVIETIAPGVPVIDLTHSVPNHDVVRGALILGRATRYMPADAVYLAVVDPGVGSERLSIAVRAANGALLVGPDNGLLSLAWEALGGAESAAEIRSEEVLLHPISKTFHGRDVFAPAAAHLCLGLPIGSLGSPIDPSSLGTIETPGPMIAEGALGARVVGVDRYGNVQLNATLSDLKQAGLGDVLKISGLVLARVETFTDAAEGIPVWMVDSQGQLALVLNRGSAAEVFRLKAGSAIVIE